MTWRLFNLFYAFNVAHHTRTYISCPRSDGVVLMLFTYVISILLPMPGASHQDSLGIMSFSLPFFESRFKLLLIFPNQSTRKIREHKTLYLSRFFFISLTSSHCVKFNFTQNCINKKLFLLQFSRRETSTSTQKRRENFLLFFVHYFLLGFVKSINLGIIQT